MINFVSISFGKDIYLHKSTCLRRLKIGLKFVLDNSKDLEENKKGVFPLLKTGNNLVDYFLVQYTFISLKCGSRKAKRVGIILNVNNMEIAFFLAMGWCGTKYPGWWKSFLKNPQPVPDPEPWWLIATISLGLMAGLSGGTLFSNAIMENHFFSGQTAIASGLFAFCTANVVTGIATAFKN